MRFFLGWKRYFCGKSTKETTTNMKRILSKSLWVCLALLLQTLGSCAFASKGGDGELAEGSEMPAFTLNSEKYGTVTPADLKGKVVLVTLFATWCPPCQLELAEVEAKIYPAYKNNPDFRLLVIGREHTDEQLTVYNEKKKFSFPLYPDPKKEVFSLFADKSIPRSYLFGRNGKLIYSTLGYEDGDGEKMMQQIAEALK